MKIFLILLLSTSFTFNLLGQTEIKTIDKADSLINNKKYNSAFTILEHFDPSNDKPNIVLLKEKIALNYFVMSIMHQIFSFKDIKENENIMEYRGKQGSSDLHYFKIDSVLNRLIKIYPNDCNLYKGLANYYYQVYLCYGNKWINNENEIFKLIAKNDKKVIDNNCANYLTYYVMGFISLSNKEYKKAIPFFLKSIKMDENNADANYNIAYAYLYTNDRTQALIYAKKSLGLYTDTTNKSDAARMIGEIYKELNNNMDAIKYYELANQIQPNNYYNIKPLLNLYIQTNNKNSKNLIQVFFDLDPTNPTIYNDLEAIFDGNGEDSLLTKFYKAQLTQYKDSAIVNGNINFYLGRITLSSNKNEAKKYFLTAKQIFKKIYTSDNQVFKAIDAEIKQTN